MTVLVRISALLLALLAAPTLGAQSATVDPTRLPIGDGNVSSSAVHGSVWSCQSTFRTNGGGAFAAGAWIKANGTFDFTAKPTVDGSVVWPHEFRITVVDGARRIEGNDLPNHPTGTFPVARSDDAFNYDRNPNSIRAQNVLVEMRSTPVVAAQPTCLPMGPIGVLISGGYVFNALDVRGQDAVAHEIQDGCQGHPEASGAYHYHNVTSCIADPGTGHSQLVGYAFDGFGIYGKRGEGGKILSNADLDECHGHTHDIEWDGRTVPLYHYHATWEYPYTLGCYRGTPATRGAAAGRGGGRGGRGGRGGAAAVDGSALFQGSSSRATGAAVAGTSATASGGSATAVATVNSPVGISSAASAPPTATDDILSVITLGTGSPRLDAERAGPANLIQLGDRHVLVDAGNGVQMRLQEAGIPLDRMDAVLITHHHLDHDQELIPFVITSLVRGNAPMIAGAPGTAAMIEFMKEFYREDISYRMDRSPARNVNLDSLNVRDLAGGEKFSVAGASVTTARVNHTIHTVAYRFDLNGRSIVISGDLAYSESLVQLARGADVLVMDSGTLPSPAGEAPAGGARGRGAGARAGGAGPAAVGRGGRAGRAGQAGGAGAGTVAAGVAGANVLQGAQQRAHPTLAEVASMASQAGVKCLVLSHINQPAVDEAATRTALRAGFSGNVVVARDLMSVNADCVVGSARRG